MNIEDENSVTMINITDENIAESRTNLIVNYLPSNITEQDVHDLFAIIGELRSCKLINTPGLRGNSIGHAFINYVNSEKAAKAIRLLNGVCLHNKKIKVSYAKPNGSTYICASLYISGLPKDTTLDDLNTIFGVYGQILSSRILFENSDCIPTQYQNENNLGMSRGVAYIYYKLHSEANNAIDALNGKILWGSAIPLRIKFVKNIYNLRRNKQRNCNRFQRALVPRAVRNRLPPFYNSIFGYEIFVYNLHHDCDKVTLWQLFGPYGAVTKAYIVQNANNISKRYGFVTMNNYYEAVRAIHMLNGLCYKHNILQVRFKRNKSKRM